jgi:hypothetical protein
VKLLLLTPLTFSLNVALRLVLALTPLAPVEGVVLVTVGGVVSGAGGAAVLKLHEVGLSGLPAASAMEEES